jgi:hypothetical protein
MLQDQAAMATVAVKRALNARDVTFERVNG